MIRKLSILNHVAKNIVSKMIPKSMSRWGNSMWNGNRAGKVRTSDSSGGVSRDVKTQSKNMLPLLSSGITFN